MGGGNDLKDKDKAKGKSDIGWRRVLEKEDKS